MKTLYIYVLDTLADWELGHLLPEIKSKRFFKKSAKELQLIFVGNSMDPITTMGGLTIQADICVDAIEIDANNVLVLPGADTWNDAKHQAIINVAEQFLEKKATVAAICGATIALANGGVLDNRQHTSNGQGFLELFAPNYQGTNHYQDHRSLSGDKLITAGSAGTLLWTKHILEALEVFNTDSLDFWYDYFETGDASIFFSVMESLK